MIYIKFSTHVNPYESKTTNSLVTTSRLNFRRKKTYLQIVSSKTNHRIFSHTHHNKTPKKKKTRKKKFEKNLMEKTNVTSWWVDCRRCPFWAYWLVPCRTRCRLSFWRRIWSPCWTWRICTGLWPSCSSRAKRGCWISSGVCSSDRRRRLVSGTSWRTASSRVWNHPLL